MPVAATAGRPRAAEGARVLQPPATRMLEAVSVESEPLPPNDPLEHRYDARQPGRARPAGAGAAAAPGRGIFLLLRETEKLKYYK